MNVLLYFRYNSFTELKRKLLNAPNVDTKSLEQLKKEFKILLAGSLYKMCKRYHLSIFDSSSATMALKSIALNSPFFHGAAGYIECTLDYYRSNKDVYIFGRTGDMKSGFREWKKFLRHELKGVSRICEICAANDTSRHIRRVFINCKKTLMFFSCVLWVLLFNKLPTYLSADEFHELNHKDAFGNSAKRYALSPDNRAYVRVGGLPRRSAINLFGFDACTVLIVKAVKRFDMHCSIKLGH